MPPSRIWTQSEDDLLRTFPTLTWQDMAGQFGISRWTVVDRAKRIGAWKQSPRGPQPFAFAGQPPAESDKPRFDWRGATKSPPGQGHENTLRSVPIDRIRLMERFTSVRIIGPALTCQSVENPGRYGIGIEFCGKQSRKGRSYCEFHCGLYLAQPDGWLADKSLAAAARRAA